MKEIWRKKASGKFIDLFIVVEKKNKTFSNFNLVVFDDIFFMIFLVSCN
jgi:hypothetical protein